MRKDKIYSKTIENLLYDAMMHAGGIKHLEYRALALLCKFHSLPDVPPQIKTKLNDTLNKTILKSDHIINIDSFEYANFIKEYGKFKLTLSDLVTALNSFNHVLNYL